MSAIFVGSTFLLINKFKKSPLSTDDVEMIEQPWSDSQMKCKVQINNDCVFTNYTGHCTET